VFTFYKTKAYKQVLMEEGIMTMPRKMSEVVLGAYLFIYYALLFLESVWVFI
jgi:hypothetical protein